MSDEGAGGIFVNSAGAHARGGFAHTPLASWGGCLAPCPGLMELHAALPRTVHVWLPSSSLLKAGVRRQSRIPPHRTPPAGTALAALFLACPRALHICVITVLLTCGVRRLRARPGGAARGAQRLPGAAGRADCGAQLVSGVRLDHRLLRSLRGAPGARAPDLATPDTQFAACSVARCDTSSEHASSEHAPLRRKSVGLVRHIHWVQEPHAACCAKDGPAPPAAGA